MVNTPTHVYYMLYCSSVKGVMDRQKHGSILVDKIDENKHSYNVRFIFSILIFVFNDGG